MSLRAVGWLSSALGVDMTGRQGGAQPTETEAPRAGAYASLNSFMQRLSEGVFGGNGGGGDDPFGRNVGVDETGEQLQVDADGLPVGRNWYAFNEANQRWEPTPDAPASVKADFETKLREAEAIAAGQNAPVDLPPPPPASMFAVPAGPTAPRGAQPLYADTGLFATAAPVPAPMAPAGYVPSFPAPPAHTNATTPAPFVPSAFFPGAAAAPIVPISPSQAPPGFTASIPTAPGRAMSPMFPAPPMQGGFGTLPPLPPLQ